MSINCIFTEYILFQGFERFFLFCVSQLSRSLVVLIQNISLMAVVQLALVILVLRTKI